jgi:hypothetical protein
MAKKESPKLKSEEVTPVLEPFELLISDRYELTSPISTHVYRYADGSVLITSMELNLYAEGDTEYEARRNFSDILVEQVEDLESFVEQGRRLGRDLELQLALLRRLLRRLEDK